MDSLITGFHIVNIILLIIVVLVQSGKGAEVSASFGGGSQTVFGSSGGANFFTYLTAGCAAIFMLTSLALTIMGARQSRSTFDDAPVSSEKNEISIPAQETSKIPGATDKPAKNPADSGSEKK